jgi:hypothetical protein
MNYYLIWTNNGWIKTPTYNHVICSGVFDSYDDINTTQDICCAYRFDERQVREGIDLLQKFGVASWVIESKEDILQSVLEELRNKRKEKNNG